MKQFIKEVFSGANGIASSKRIIGGLSMLVILGCTIYLVITEGCSENVENLLQTLIVTSCGLLGVSSVTSIWKNNKTTINNKENE